MKLEDFLEKHKSELEPEQFRERLSDVFAEMYPGLTVERMTCSWRYNRDFARAACRSTKIPITPDTEFQVVWELNNMRKASKGKLNLYERSIG